jgi:hypothetical protein
VKESGLFFMIAPFCIELSDHGATARDAPRHHLIAERQCIAGFPISAGAGKAACSRNDYRALHAWSTDDPAPKRFLFTASDKYRSFLTEKCPEHKEAGQSAGALIRRMPLRLGFRELLFSLSPKVPT